MKIFNVSIRIDIFQIAELPDIEPVAPSPKPFNDDPIDKQQAMLEGYLNKAANIFGQRPFLVAGQNGPDGQSLTHSVRIHAETFEDVQAILAKFHAVAHILPAVPDSLLRESLNAPR